MGTDRLQWPQVGRMAVFGLRAQVIDGRGVWNHRRGRGPVGRAGAPHV